MKNKTHKKPKPNRTARSIVRSLFFLWLFCTVMPGCRSHHPQDTNTPDQNFVASMNHLLGNSPTQSAQLEPIWITYREKKKSLKARFPNNSDEFVEKLAKLHQDTVAQARPHLEAAQSARLEEIFAEQRQRIEHTRKVSDQVAEKDATEGPLTRPPKESKGDNKPQMGSSGGAGGAGGW